MTPTQTREPARTPADAQSAGSRHILNATIRALTTVTVAGIGIGAAALAHKSYPDCALMALLLMPFINTLIPDRSLRPSGGRRATSPQPTPEDYMPGGGL